jgi:phosphonate transport system ATP-binding protein
VLTNVLMGRLNHVTQWRSLLSLWTKDERAIALSALEQLGIAAVGAHAELTRLAPA